MPQAIVDLVKKYRDRVWDKGDYNLDAIIRLLLCFFVIILLIQVCSYLATYLIAVLTRYYSIGITWRSYQVRHSWCVLCTFQRSSVNIRPRQGLDLYLPNRLENPHIVQRLAKHEKMWACCARPRAMYPWRAHLSTCFVWYWCSGLISLCAVIIILLLYLQNAYEKPIVLIGV